MFGAGDEVCRRLKGIGNEELDYPAEEGQGVGLVHDLLLNLVEYFVGALIVTLPKLEIVGHKKD